MASIFTRIVNGEIPCYKVAETEDFLGFLDINPLTKGHTLVIPKKEIDYIFDLPDDLYIGLHLFSRAVSSAIRKTVACERIATAVVGLEVPHAHIHLVPIQHIDDLNFSNPRLRISQQEMQTLASSIRDNMLS